MALAIDGILTLAPERTLLEKALILHGWHCGYRDLLIPSKVPHGIYRAG